MVNAVSNQTPSRRSLNARIVQNFHIVWLNVNIDEKSNDDFHKSKIKLQEVVNTVNTFTDLDECIDFITDKQEEMTFLIISQEFSQDIMSIIQDIRQIRSVYIYSQSNASGQKWLQEDSKVKGIHADITFICDVLKQETKNCDRNLFPISFLKKTDGISNQNLNTLNSSFMYTRILKDILLTINFEEIHFKEFLTYCRQELFADNIVQVKNVDLIEEEYIRHDPIWWYTYSSFLYSMVNRSLRLMDVELIIKVGFFIKDLYNHILTLHGEQYGTLDHLEPFVVYRGQGLSLNDFEKLNQAEGGLLSFNSFLSTSRNENVSFVFADIGNYNTNEIGVIFKITIDRPVLQCQFAEIKDVSYFKDEEEVLFSMHSVFRIGSIEPHEQNNHIWQVNLTLTDDTDPQLDTLTKCIQEETAGFSGWYRIVYLMYRLGHSNKAEELCKVLLSDANDELEKGYLSHMLGIINANRGEYKEALNFNENAVEIFRKTLSDDHLDLAISYNNIGGVYSRMNEYSKALSYYKKAVEIYQKTLPENHLHFANSYKNIGSVYNDMGKYSNALSYYEKAAEIYEKTLPKNHPHLATFYNNMGKMYSDMGKYSNALLYFEKSLEIYQKTLPEDHPHLAASYNNLGFVYYSRTDEHLKALSYYEKAVEIYKKTLGENHPDLATSYNNLGLVYYSRMGKHSEALSYYEKALQIFKTTLPKNHPHLAYSYNNIGWVYYNMGEYLKTLSYFQRALDIAQGSLLSDHPNIKHIQESIENVKTKL